MDEKYEFQLKNINNGFLLKISFFAKKFDEYSIYTTLFDTLGFLLPVYHRNSAWGTPCRCVFRHAFSPLMHNRMNCQTRRLVGPLARALHGAAAPLRPQPRSRRQSDRRLRQRVAHALPRRARGAPALLAARLEQVRLGL